jgi:hypothetical protein
MAHHSIISILLYSSGPQYTYLGDTKKHYVISLELLHHYAAGLLPNSHVHISRDDEASPLTDMTSKGSPTVHS